MAFVMVEVLSGWKCCSLEMVRVDTDLSLRLRQDSLPVASSRYNLSLLSVILHWVSSLTFSSCMVLAEVSFLSS